MQFMTLTPAPLGQSAPIVMTIVIIAVVLGGPALLWSRAAATPERAQRTREHHVAERVDSGREKLAAMQAEQERKKKRKSAIMLIGGLLAVVLAVVATMALVSHNKDKKPAASSSTSGSAGAQPSYVTTMQKVPDATFDAVGKGSAGDLTTLKGTKATTGKTAKIVYYGGEFCPYCGMQRWAIVSALSRFGTWKGLEATSSSEANIPTVSFQHSSYSSPYLTFTGYEIMDQQHNALMKPNAADQANFTKFDTHEYFPDAIDEGSSGAVPFMMYGTDKGTVGALFDGQAMSGASGDDIAKKLSDTNDDTTKGIIGAANVITADICAQNGGQPAKVCNSAGVKAAAASN